MMKFLCLAISFMLLVGCAGPNALIKIDGNVDPVESAIIQTAVGLSMSILPDAVPPAYAVSTAILSRIDSNSVLLSGLDAAVASEVNRLDLIPAETAAVMDLIGIIRAQIVTQLETEGITAPDQRLIVVRQVVEIVRSSAAARLGVSAE